MKKYYKNIILITVFILFSHLSFADSTIENLKTTKKTSYLDFVLLKIENRLMQRHSLMGAQPVAFRIQYQSISSQVDFLEEESKIMISVIGVMDKARYSKKKYKPKLSDCNILRNLLLYGKYGYNIIFQKRNVYLTSDDMKRIFLQRFLNNLSLSEKEKNDLINNTFIQSKIIDPVRGNDFFCSGGVADDELK